MACQTVFAEKAEKLNDKTYIGANLSMSFKNFSYQSFIDNAMTAEGDDSKLLSGPRYDFVAGYRLSHNIRAEAQYLMISKSNFETDKTNSKVEYKATGIFASLIYDFWDFQDNQLTPFIGVGVGIGSPNLNVSYNGVKNEVDNNGFSWQFQAGVNLRLLDWLIVNVKYSYLSMPNINKTIADETNPSVDFLKSEFEKGVQSAGVGVIILL